MSKLTTNARPYAKAVFEFARDAGDYTSWSERLLLLATLVEDAEVRRRLENPALRPSQRTDMVIAICGDYLVAEAQNLVRLLAENNRLSLLTEIAALYEKYRADAEGITEACVVSAFALSDKERDSIVKALGQRLKSKVTLKCEVDESLLGGAVVQAGDMVIDGSIRGKIDKLSVQLSR